MVYRDRTCIALAGCSSTLPGSFPRAAGPRLRCIHGHLLIVHYTSRIVYNFFVYFVNKKMYIVYITY